jgi:hypothetical protein
VIFLSYFTAAVPAQRALPVSLRTRGKLVRPHKLEQHINVLLIAQG